MKLNINSVEVNPQLSKNDIQVDGVLVDVGG
jgi:hypothetical protein